jgi:hypothetical protein
MQQPVEEGGSFLYEYRLVDRTGTPVPAGSVESLVMSLYKRGSKEIIATKDHIDVLNANNGTYGEPNADGFNGSMKFLAADNPIIDDTLTYEMHVALFEAAWEGGGTKKWELYIQVRNLTLVPAP